MQKAVPALLLCALLGCGHKGPDGSAHPAPAPSPGTVCTSDQWCWWNPLPGGARVDGLWSTSFDSIWAAGTQGLLRFDGAKWSSEPTPLAAGGRLRALWGSSPTDLYAAGDDVFHWDGKAWSAVKVVDGDAEFLALTGTSANDVYVLADHGDGPDENHTIYHWDGKSWSSSYGPVPPGLSGMFADGTGTVWAVGIQAENKGPLLLRMTHSGWAPVFVPGSLSLRSVWGSAPDDVWLGGAGVLFHWDGKALTQVAPPDGSGIITSLHGTGRDDVWATAGGSILHWDGKLWTTAYVAPKNEERLLRAVRATGTHDAWAAGDDGLLLQFDGASWRVYQQGTNWYLEGVAATEPSDAWAVGGNGTALRFDGTRWAQFDTPTREPLYAAWASSANDVWAVGSSGDCLGFVLRWNGSAWAYSSTPQAGRCLQDLSGSGPQDVWAVGSHVILHYDGAWQLAPITDASDSIWAAGPTDVWALQDSTPGGPNANGGVYHWDGNQWSLTQTGSDARLRKLWGAGAGDVWAVGDDGTQTWHYSGGAWSAVPTGLDDGSAGLTALWGRSASDVWAGSRNGSVLLHWEGKAWSAQGGAAILSVTALSGASGLLWAVGPNGAIWRHP
jgi:hypothetical protein